MKNKISEAFFSFLAFFLLGCTIAAAIVLGMLLLPFCIIVLFVLAVREVIRWKRTGHHLHAKDNIVVKQQEAPIVRSIAPFGEYKRTA